MSCQVTFADTRRAEEEHIFTLMHETQRCQRLDQLRGDIHLGVIVETLQRAGMSDPRQLQVGRHAALEASVALPGQHVVEHFDGGQFLLLAGFQGRVQRLQGRLQTEGFQVPPRAVRN